VDGKKCDLAQRCGGEDGHGSPSLGEFVGVKGF
jgi:hypothetical protein